LVPALAPAALEPPEPPELEPPPPAWQNRHAVCPPAPALSAGPHEVLP